MRISLIFILLVCSMVFAPGNPRSWRNYLQKVLYHSVKIPSKLIHNSFHVIYQHTTAVQRFCFINRAKSLKSIVHYEYLPCGRIKYTTPMILNTNINGTIHISWLFTLQVQKSLYLNLTFSHFSLQDSVFQCQTESLMINRIGHCGKRRPWTELIFNNRLDLKYSLFRQKSDNDEIDNGKYVSHLQVR